jgi:hypothetical protein
MNNIKFEVVSGGEPTEEELLAIHKALYQTYNPKPSLYGRPQLRSTSWEFRRT